MPTLEQLDRYQKAVYWPYVSTDDYGEAVVGVAQELTVRWVNRRREVLDANGNTVSIDATVITDREIAIGSRMWLGSIDDLPGTGSADPPTSNIMTVVAYNKTPSLLARETHHEVLLSRDTNTLPEG